MLISQSGRRMKSSIAKDYGSRRNRIQIIGLLLLIINVYLPIRCDFLASDSHERLASDVHRQVLDRAIGCPALDV